MLIQFEQSSRTALGGNDMRPGSHMREGASRNPAIQLGFGAVLPSGAPTSVASSRGEEMTTHHSSSRDHGDAEFRDSVVFYVLGILFLTPLILAGIAVKFG